MSTAGMMPPSFEDAAIAEVRDAVEETASRKNCTVTQDAEDFLVEDGPDFLAANPQVLPLDRQLLDAQLDEVFETVAKDIGPLKGKRLERGHFEKALPNVVCHYIWFC